MEDARIVETGEPITGEDLWYMDDVKAYTYECLVCKLACNPASFVKDVNKQRPHFRPVPKGAEHKDGCPYGKDGMADSSASVKSKNGHAQNRPDHYPSKFVLPRERKVINAVSKERSSDDTTAGENKEPSGGYTPSDKQTDKRDYKTESFRMIVNHFVNFPQDRYLPFEAEGVDGNTYKSCFHSLYVKDEENIVQPRNKIYYSVVSWKKVDFDAQPLRIEFNSGLFVEIKGKKRPKNKFYLELDTSNWSERILNAFKHDFEKSRKDAYESNGTKKGLLFFIGEQDLSVNRFCFFGIDPRLIAIKVV